MGMDPATLAIIGSTVIGSGADIYGAHQQDQTNAQNLAIQQLRYQQLTQAVQGNMMQGQNPYASAINQFIGMPVGQQQYAGAGSGQQSIPTLAQVASQNAAQQAAQVQAYQQSLAPGSEQAKSFAAQQKLNQVFPGMFQQAINARSSQTPVATAGQGMQAAPNRAMMDQVGGLPNTGYQAFTGPQMNGAIGQVPQGPGFSLGDLQGFGAPIAPPGAPVADPRTIPGQPGYAPAGAPGGGQMYQYQPGAAFQAQAYQLGSAPLIQAPQVSGAPTLKAQDISGLPQLSAPTMGALPQLGAQQIGGLPQMSAGTIDNLPQLSNQQVGQGLPQLGAQQIGGLPNASAQQIGGLPQLSIPDLMQPTGTQGFNAGQDGLMQLMNKQLTPSNDPSLSLNLQSLGSGNSQFDNTDLFNALKTQQNFATDQQVGALHASAGSLGERFGTAMNQNEGLLRSQLTAQNNLQNAQIASQSFENAQNRRMPALAQMSQNNQFNDQFGLNAANLNMQAANSLMQNGLGLSGQQLQAGIANQGNQLAAQQGNLQAGLTAQQSNQSAGLNAQQLNIQAQLAAMQSNQGANLTAQQGNLQAMLAAQQANAGNNLSAQQGNLQAALAAQQANQGNSLQAQQGNLNAALAAAQANAGNNLTAQQGNLQAALAAAQANGGFNLSAQQGNLQAALAAAQSNQQAGLTAGQSNINSFLQQALANQAASLTASQSNQNTMQQYAMGNANILNQNSQFNAGQQTQNNQFAAQMGQNYNSQILQALGLSGNLQQGQNQYNAQLLGILGGVGVPQAQASQLPGALSDAASSAAFLPMLLQMMGQQHPSTGIPTGTQYGGSVPGIYG